MCNSLKILCVSTASIVFIGCSSQKVVDLEAKDYHAMSEVEQQVYIDGLAHEMNTGVAATNGQSVTLKGKNAKYYGDAEHDIMYFEVKHPVVVPNDKLNAFSAGVAEALDHEGYCETSGIAPLHDVGLSSQTIVTDAAGTILFESQICSDNKDN